MTTIPPADQCPRLSTHGVDLYEVRAYRPWAYFADYITADVELLDVRRKRR